MFNLCKQIQVYVFVQISKAVATQYVFTFFFSFFSAFIVYQIFTDWHHSPTLISSVRDNPLFSSLFMCLISKSLWHPLAVYHPFCISSFLPYRKTLPVEFLWDFLSLPSSQTPFHFVLFFVSLQFIFCPPGLSLVQGQLFNKTLGWFSSTIASGKRSLAVVRDE